MNLASGNSSSRSVRRRTEPPPVSEAQSVTFEVRGGDSGSLSKASPVAEECASYTASMTVEVRNSRDSDEVTDPCFYWPQDGVNMFPTLARVAAQVLAAEATERIASTAGVLFSPRRSRLKPETAETITYLHGALKYEVPPTARATACTARTAEFTKHQSISCQLEKTVAPRSSKLFLVVYVSGFTTKRAKLLVTTRRKRVMRIV